MQSHCFMYLTHWGWVTHICASKLTIIGSDNGLLPGQHQAIIWTNAGIFLIGPLRTNFSEMLIKIYIFWFKKMHLKMSSGIWWPYCLGLNVLKASAKDDNDGLVQDCNISSALAMEILQSCTKPSTNVFVYFNVSEKNILKLYYTIFFFIVWNVSVQTAVRLYCKFVTSQVSEEYFERNFEKVPTVCHCFLIGFWW